MVKRPLVWLLGAWSIGTLLAWLCSWGAFGAGLVIVFCGKRHERTFQRILLIGFLFAALRWNLHQSWESRVYTEPVQFRRILCKVEAVEPKARDQQWILSSEGFYGKVLAYGSQSLRVGDRLWMELELIPIENPGNPGEFDSKSYYRVRGIYYQGRIGQMELQSRETGALLQEIRSGLAERLYDLLPHVEAGILAAILLGEDAGLDVQVKEAFQQVGIAHILAISGLHVGLVYRILEKLLSRCMSARHAAFLGMFCLWGYTLLTGAAVSTLRAAIFCTIAGMQRIIGARQDALNSLAGTAWILLTLHPLYLLDMGFQMSFVSVAALLLLQSVFRRWFWLPGRARKLLSPMLAVMAGSTPVSLYYFFTWSPYQILLNLLILPVMGFLFVMGSLCLGISCFWQQGAALCAGSIYWVLYGIRRLTETVRAWPGAVWVLGRPQPVILLFYYLGWLFLLYKQNSPVRRRLMRCLPWLSWAFCLIVILWPSPRWRCVFLNVGQGDCCVLEIGRRVFLIDAGPAYRQALKPYLQSRGITRLDGVWVSHGDWDHTEGLMELLEDPDFTVENWYLPAGKIHDNERMRRIEQRGRRVYRVEAGQEIRIGGVRLTCLAPLKGGSYQDENSASMVLKVSDGRTDLLFCGDLDQDGEKRILEQAEPCEILKVGHHGSRTSSSSEWLSRLAPKLAVISCDREAGYGHPHPEVVERLLGSGARVLTTDDVGAVQIWAGWFGYHYSTGKG